MKHNSSKRLMKQRRFRGLLITLAILSLILGSLEVLVERGAPGSSITTPFDGVYWAITTLTTVGYGDLAPVTSIGRVIAMLLQIVGAMMFSMIIATIVSSMNRIQDEFYWQRMFARLDKLEEQLSHVRKRANYIVKENGQDQENGQKQENEQA